jgi:hypothetical protein
VGVADQGSDVEFNVTCPACSEENKSGSTRCARCGATLEKTEDAVVDPELAEFSATQAEVAQRKGQERLDRILRGISATGSGVEDGSDIVNWPDSHQ